MHQWLSKKENINILGRSFTPCSGQPRCGHSTCPPLWKCWCNEGCRSAPLSSTFHCWDRSVTLPLGQLFACWKSLHPCASIAGHSLTFSSSILPQDLLFPSVSSRRSVSAARPPVDDLAYFLLLFLYPFLLLFFHSSLSFNPGLLGSLNHIHTNCHQNWWLFHHLNYPWFRQIPKKITLWGETKSDKIVTWTFTKYGDHTITLIITNSGGSPQKSQ